MASINTILEKRLRESITPAERRRSLLFVLRERNLCVIDFHPFGLLRVT